MSARTLLLLLVASTAGAQNRYWRWEAPTPTGENILAVATTGFGQYTAVGTGGVILTGDAFNNALVATTSPTTVQLNDVEPCGDPGMFGISGGIIGGKGGTLLLSVLGGPYSSLVSPTSDDITAVACSGSQHMWLATSTGAILASSNGGTSWLPQTNPTGGVVTDLRPLSVTDVWATVSGGTAGILHTTTGGATWVTVGGAPTGTFRAVVGASSTQMAFYGLGGAAWTLNNTTWNQMSTGGATQDFTAACMDDGTTGLAVMVPQGAVLKHRIWRSVISSPPSLTLMTTPATVPGGLTPRATNWNNSSSAIIVGDNGLTEFYNGTAWSQYSTGQTASTFASVAVAGANGVAVGFNTTNKAVFRARVDGGWMAETTIGTLPGLTTTVMNPQGVEAWAAGGTALIHATDVTTGVWTPQDAGNASIAALAWVPDAGSTLVAAGNGLFRSTNGGVGWAQAPIVLPDGGPPSPSLVAVTFPTSTVGYAFGTTSTGGSAAFKSNNGGATWTDLPPLQGLILQAPVAVSFIDASTGMFLFGNPLGTGGYVYVTTNGGASFTEHTVMMPCGFMRGIYMLSPSIAWIISSCGAVYTTDQGVTWSTTTATQWTSQSMYAITGRGGGDLKDLWTVGGGGTILRTFCGGTSAFNACDDGNPCTTDSCNPTNGACTHTPTMATCSDSNACTSGDYCDAGACVGNAITCNDGNVCTDDTCAPATGCVYTGVATAASCDDLNSCTNNDVCHTDGGCSGMGTVCNDGNPCHSGNCTADGGCAFSFKADTTPCSDSSVCTTGDTCMNGTCVGTAISCDDMNACTSDGCDPVNGCHNDAGVVACSTGNQCVMAQTCGGAPPMCGGGVAVSCDDGNDCTVDSCDVDAGCLHAVQIGNTCDDSNSCTQNDACRSDAGCAGDAIPMCGGTGGGTGGTGGSGGTGGGNGGSGSTGGGSESVDAGPAPLIFAHGCACDSGGAGLIGLLAFARLLSRRRRSTMYVEP